MTESLRTVLRDAALPAVVAGVATAEVLSTDPGSPAAALAILWFASAVLVVRRRWPLAVGAVAGVAALLPFFGTSMADLTSPIFVIWVAEYAMGRWLPDLRGLAVVGLYLSFLVADILRAGSGGPAGDIVWVATLVAPAYVVGMLVRHWAERTGRLTRETERLAAAQERVRQETAAAERDRIARELHDVIAHSVSAMVVQMAAAQDLVRTDPDRAERVLQDVAEPVGGRRWRRRGGCCT